MGGLQSLPEREVVRTLRSIVRDRPLDRPVLNDVLAPLGEALGLQYTAAHRLAATVEEDGWDFAYVAAHPRSFELPLRSKYLPFVRGSTLGTGTYNPLRPQKEQRNRVVLLKQISAARDSAARVSPRGASPRARRRGGGPRRARGGALGALQSVIKSSARLSPRWPTMELA